MEAKFRLQETRPFLALQVLFFSLLLAIMLSSCGGVSKPTPASPAPTPNVPGSAGGTSGGSGGTGGSGGSGGSGGTPNTPGGAGQASTVAFVYAGKTNQNGPGQITGFSVTSDAVAHPLPGSPYNGPSAFPVVSSGFLFASDGTNIQTYTRNADGSLTASSSVSGIAHNEPPTGSGVGALTLDHTGSSLYAAEINFEGTDNDAYAAFNIGPSGALTFVANTAISVNANSFLHFSPDNRFAYGQGCFFLGWDLFGYQRLANGALQTIATNGNPPPSTNDQCPVGTAVSAQNVLAEVIGTPGVTANNQIATYRINSNGTLTLISNAPIVAPFFAVSAVSFDPTGTFLAAGGSGGVQLYQLTSSGDLTPLGSPAIPNANVNDVRWDNSNHLYALSGQSLHILNVSQGALSEAAGSPYAVASQGILAVLPVK